MNVTRKDATIANTDEDFPGAFEVVLSTSAKDRDGDELAAEDWKTPLPDHITFDSDHGMSVATTVGSGAPRIDETGRLVVAGSYSSLPRAQEVRTLVKEGHIRTTSVAFMSEKVTKDGKTRTVRELLNGAFVAIPSNREAVVLAAKSITDEVKAGARNAAADMARIQAIHDHTIELGAMPAMNGKAASYAVGERGPEVFVPKASGQIVNPFTGHYTKVAVAAAPAATAEPDIGALAQAVDAALDEAQALLATIDPTTLPAEVQQAIGLLTAAEEAVDELLDALGVTDPDEPVEPAEVPAPAAAGKAAPAAETTALDPHDRLTAFRAAAFRAG